MTRRWLVSGTFVLLAAFGSLLLLRDPAAAASPFFQSAGAIDVEYFPRPSDSERRILRAFEERVSLRFRDASLYELADYLREATGENVYLDTRELSDLGIDLAERTITVDLRSLPLKTGLGLILDGLELTAVVHGEMLWITSAAKAEELLVTRVYPVSDLVTYGGGQDFDPLMDLIENTLEVDSWDPVGLGTMQEFEATGVLVISQTHAVHDQVLELLRGLRASRYVNYGSGSSATASGSFFPAADRRATFPSWHGDCTTCDCCPRERSHDWPPVANCASRWRAGGGGFTCSCSGDGIRLL